MCEICSKLKIKTSEPLRRCTYKTNSIQDNTAAFNLAKYLSNLIAPLRESEYIIKSTRNLIGKVKAKEMPNVYQIVSFNVKSLFSNVPLDRTIDIVLRRVYDKHDLQTSIARLEMKELLILCTKKFHFTFDNVIKVQNDGMAMGLPLEPVLSDIFMIELERSLLPELTICKIGRDTSMILFVLKKLDQLITYYQF